VAPVEITNESLGVFPSWPCNLANALASTDSLKTMKASVDSVVLAINLVLLGSRALPAQLSIHASADAAIAHAAVTGGEYLQGERGKLATAGGAYIDLGLQRTPLQLVLGVTGERYYNGDKVNAICVPGSHGQCLTRVPNLGGLIGLLGLRFEPLPAVSALAAFGYGDVGSPGEGDRAPTNARADEIRLEARVRVQTHLALGARYQYITVPNYTGIRLTTRPVSLVLSLQ
jgi:hypothetical protein